MKKAYFVLLPFILLLAGCNQKHPSGRKLIWKGIDTITFPENLSIGMFNQFTIEGHRYLSVYDFKSHDIFLSGIDSVSQIRIKGSKISSSDTTIGNNLNAYFIQNADSIFWLYENAILITNRSAEIIYKRYINKPGRDSADFFYYGMLGPGNFIYYDGDLRSLFLYRYRRDIDFWDNKWSATSPQVKYDFDDSSFHSLPMSYPEMYSKNYYGDALESYNTTADDKNIVSFMGSDEVIIYTRASGVVRKSKMATSLFTKTIKPFDYKKIDPLDIQQKMDYLLETPIYMDIFFDPRLKLYYRLAHNGLDRKNRNGTYNTFEKKPLIISIYDSSFNQICDQKMNDNFHSNFGYPTHKGFNLYKNRTIGNDGKNKLCFDAFALQ